MLFFRAWMRIELTPTAGPEGNYGKSFQQAARYMCCQFDGSNPIRPSLARFGRFNRSREGAAVAVAVYLHDGRENRKECAVLL